MKHPNWITENDWSDERRLHWLNILMAFDSRDWSVYPHAVGGAPDVKQWSIWCLVCSDTKGEAIEAWDGFVNDNQVFK